MQLSSDEVQVAITEYLRKRGAVVADPQQVRLEIHDRHGARISLVGGSAVVVAYDIKLPDGPFR